MMLSWASRRLLPSSHYFSPCVNQSSALGRVSGNYVQKCFVHVATRPNTGVLVNKQINVKWVLLLDDKGKKIGEMSLYDAIAKAKEKDMDVLCMDKKQNPPICKIYDYGKYKYENEKAKKKVAPTKLKELRFNSNIAEHDVSNKVNAATKFLTSLMNVKVTVTFDGQVDMTLAEAMIENIYSRVSFFAKRDNDLLTANKFVSCTFHPIPDKVKKIKDNPDKTVEELEDEAADASAKKAAKEASRQARIASQPASTTPSGTSKTEKVTTANANKTETEAKIEAATETEVEAEAEAENEGDENDAEVTEEEVEEATGVDEVKVSASSANTASSKATPPPHNASPIKPIQVDSPSSTTSPTTPSTANTSGTSMWNQPKFSPGTSPNQSQGNKWNNTSQQRQPFNNQSTSGQSFNNQSTSNQSFNNQQYNNQNQQRQSFNNQSFNNQSSNQSSNFSRPYNQQYNNQSRSFNNSNQSQSFNNSNQSQSFSNQSQSFSNQSQSFNNQSQRQSFGNNQPFRQSFNPNNNRQSQQQGRISLPNSRQQSSKGVAALGGGAQQVDEFADFNFNDNEFFEKPNRR